MVSVGLREGQPLAPEAREALPNVQVPALKTRGLAAALFGRLMRFGG